MIIRSIAQIAKEVKDQLPKPIKVEWVQPQYLIRDLLCI